MGSILGITAGQAAINTASGIVGQTIGRIFAPRDRANQLKQQEALNEQAYDINNRMAEANYEREMRKWNETNYSAQMEQLNKAGLNAGLLYGMSGGGGATASAAPGQGVGAGQAESSRQGMGIMPIDMIAIQTAKAQQELIKAQTEKVKAETTNVPLTGKNIEASTGNIIADTALKNISTTIAELNEQYQNRTLEQAIANFYEKATIIHQQARSAMAQGDIDQSTKEDRIKQINAGLLNTLMNTETMKQAISESASRMKVQDQQVQSMIQERILNMMQDYDNLNAQHRTLNNEDLNRMYKNIADEMKMGEDIIKMIGGAMIGAGIKGMPKTTETETLGDGPYGPTWQKSKSKTY